MTIPTTTAAARVPLVSVIVAVHNGEDTLPAALASLQAQTLPDLEMLVVDDHSTDGTWALLQEMSRCDGRIRPLRLATNLGVHEARASGLRQARAPWIAFLDADDLALPTMLEQMHAAAENFTADIVLCGSRRVTPEGRSLGTKVRFSRQQLWNQDIFAAFCRLEFGTGALWNKLYRAELIRHWGTQPHRWPQNGTEDTLVNIGCFWQVRRVVALPAVLHHYVDQPGSLTSNIDAEKAFTKIVRAFAIAVDLYARLGPQALAGIANLYRAQFAYEVYALPWQDDLPAWSKELAEPLNFLAQEHPQALALLLARLPSPLQLGFRASFSRRLRGLLPSRNG